MTALMIVGLVLVLIILVGNTMIALAFLRSRGGWKGLQGRDRDAMDELHKRVEALPARRK
jgi:hypothetical protein